MRKRRWTKAALAFSACLFVIWWALGTGATLAWFSDADEVRNEFQIGLLDLDVSYKNNIVKEYTPLQGSTEVFDDQALYEPGYTQVVYFQIENKGNVDFDYKFSVEPDHEKKAVNVYGREFYLSQYLRFCAVFATSEEELTEQVKETLATKSYENSHPLSTWSKYSDETFAAGMDPHYAALILFMPTDVDNVANYRGSIIPEIQLGIVVYAQQAGTPME